MHYVNYNDSFTMKVVSGHFYINSFSSLSFTERGVSQIYQKEELPVWGPRRRAEL